MTDPHHDRLDGTHWLVTSVGGVDVAPDAPRTVDFAEGRVSGQVGVNRFSAGYELLEDDGVGAVATRPAMLTRMAGPPELMALESEFHRALRGLPALARDEDRLELGDDATALVLSAVPPEIPSDLTT